MVLPTHMLRYLCLALAATVVAGTSVGLAQSPSGGQVDSVDLDVLMRGPVHEGFAEPGLSSEVPDQAFGSMQLPEPIPDPIDERPARARPQDGRRQAMWLPGYWGVEDSEHLCWVSGTWRYSPPGMRWVPGYWSQGNNGWVWVPGFWLDESMEQIDYLPAPPAPPQEAIGYREIRDGRFWVPGKYVWQGGQYRWVDGFWSRVQSDWVWVPQRLVYTPRGYVQVNGYWDYPVDRRGTLFAPVRLTAQNRLRRAYRPSIAINAAQALASLFIRPQYGHYYFGNYYGSRYQNFGLQPWAAYAGNVNRYDPLYVYYSASRNDYLQDLVRTHQRLLQDDGLRLPVMYNDYRQLRGRGVQQPFLNQFARSVDELVTGDADGFEDLRPLEEIGGDNVLQRLERQAENLRQFARGRRQTEVGRFDGRDREGRFDRPDRRDPRFDRDDDDRDFDDRPRRDDDRDERFDREDRRERMEDAQESREDRLEDAREELEDRAEDAREQREERLEDARERREQDDVPGQRPGDRDPRDRDPRDQRPDVDRGEAGRGEGRSEFGGRTPFDLRPYRNQFGRPDGREGQPDGRQGPPQDTPGQGAGQQRPTDRFSPPSRLGPGRGNGQGPTGDRGPGAGRGPGNNPGQGRGPGGGGPPGQSRGPGNTPGTGGNPGAGRPNADNPGRGGLDAGNRGSASGSPGRGSGASPNPGSSGAAQPGAPAPGNAGGSPTPSPAAGSDGSPQPAAAGGNANGGSAGGNPGAGNSGDGGDDE